MSLSALFAGESIKTVGWTLVHFIWQGAGLAILLYAILPLFRTASARYTAAVACLAAMAASPVATYFVLQSHTAVLTSVPAMAKAAETFEAAGQAAAMSVAGEEGWRSLDLLSGLVAVWFSGVVLFSIRAFGGWLLLERLRRETTGLPQSVRSLCATLQRRVGVTRTIAYLQSNSLDAPAVAGWFRPVVLLPASALTGLSFEQLEAVIAHELAHIKRLDCFVNLFQIAVEAVLFYHPAVWLVNRTVRAERENCCDDWAVSVCGSPYEYAKALTTLEESRVPPALVLAANGGELKLRVGRLLGYSAMRTGVPRAGLFMIGLVITVGALFGGTQLNGTIDDVASIERPPSPPAAASEELTSVPAPVEAVPPSPPPPARPKSREKHSPAIDWQSSGDEQYAVRVNTHLVMSAREEEQAAPVAPSENRGRDRDSYINAMNAAGYRNLSVDDLVALRIQDVTPEYVREMRAAGLDPNVHDLIGMKVQGVDPQWVKEIRSTGLNPSLHELIAMKIQGVSSDFVRDAMTHGLKNESVGEIIAMKIQGVHPGDAAEYRRAGLDDVSLKQMIGMKVQGVTPEYVREMRSAGFNSISSHDFIAARVQGIDPEFIRKAKSHGFGDLSVHKLIALKMADVF